MLIVGQCFSLDLMNNSCKLYYLIGCSLARKYGHQSPVAIPSVTLPSSYILWLLAPVLQFTSDFRTAFNVWAQGLRTRLPELGILFNIWSNWKPRVDPMMSSSCCFMRNDNYPTHRHWQINRETEDFSSYKCQTNHEHTHANIIFEKSSGILLFQSVVTLGIDCYFVILKLLNLAYIHNNSVKPLTSASQAKGEAFSRIKQVMAL